MAEKIFVKDVHGQWYELDLQALKENAEEREPEAAWEAIAAEATEKRKRLEKHLEKLDQQDIAILRDLLMPPPYRWRYPYSWRGPAWGCEVCDVPVGPDITPDASAQPGMPVGREWVDRMRRAGYYPYYRWGRPAWGCEVCDVPVGPDITPDASAQPGMPVGREWVDRMRRLRYYGY